MVRTACNVRTDLPAPMGRLVRPGTQAAAEQGGLPMTDVRRVLMVCGRVLLWGAVALVLVRGVLSIVEPARSAARPVVTSSPAGRFPQDAATAFAARFAHDYLTYDAAHPDLHRQQMAAYLPQG